MLAILLLGAASICTAAKAQAPEVRLGWPTMQVAAGDIYSGAGERVVLRGVNEMFAFSNNRRGIGVMEEIAKTGANSVRIVTVTDFSPEDLDAVIGNAVANGLIPMPECHSATGRWERLNLCVEYWTRPEIAAVIARHSQWVLLNIANEAGDDSVTAEQFVGDYGKAIRRIRAAGIEVPLVIDGSDWGKEYEMLLDSWDELNAIDPEHAVITSAHSYWIGSEAERLAHYRRIIQRVTSERIPFVLGEGPTPSGHDCTASPYQQAMTELQDAGIGWLAWSWGMAPNGDCRAENRYDMTRGGMFGSWKNEAGRMIAIDHPASIRNTSRRPCSIPDAGANCVRPGPAKDRN